MKLKWVFGALVLANLGLWMWASWYREPAVGENRAARAPIAPEKMRLLSEPGVKLQARKAPPPADAALAPGAPQVCFHVGPFADADAAAKGESKLNDLHLGFVRQTEQTKNVGGYRVYLPPLASKEEAERKRRLLTRIGFKDHALIQEGASRYIISLGLFNVEANARSRVHELAAKGITARIEPIVQTHTRYWLNVNVPLPPDTAAQVKQVDWGTQDVQAQETACPAVTAPGPPPAPAHEPPDNAPH